MAIEAKPRARQRVMVKRTMKDKKRNPWKLRLPDSHTHKFILLVVVVVILFLLGRVLR